jgi:hypothetical protein
MTARTRLAAAALANEFAGDQALADSLRARAEKIAVPDDTEIAVASIEPQHSGAALRPLSRSEYARFAAATGRVSSLCREKLSLLRIVKPRDWKTPGFEQTESQPVVCVSYEDAVALCALGQPQRPARAPADERGTGLGAGADGWAQCRHLAQGRLDRGHRLARTTAAHDRTDARLRRRRRATRARVTRPPDDGTLPA